MEDGGRPNGRTWTLRMTREQVVGIAVLSAAGRISGETAPLFAEALGAAAADSRTVMVDLSAVDYLSGAGLSAIQHAAGRLAAVGGAIVLCGLSDPVRIAADLSGLLTDVRIEGTRAAAIEACGTAAQFPMPNSQLPR